MRSEPTSYRKDDNDEIKHIPSHSEKVLSQCKHFEDALPSEDNNED